MAISLLFSLLLLVDVFFLFSVGCLTTNEHVMAMLMLWVMVVMLYLYVGDPNGDVDVDVVFSVFVAIAFGAVIPVIHLLMFLLTLVLICSF